MKFLLSIKASLLLVPALVLIASSARADFMTFTDRTAWEAAVDLSTLKTADFDNIAAETKYDTASLDLGHLSLQASGAYVAPSNDLNEVQAGGGSLNVDGTPYANAVVLAERRGQDFTPNTDELFITASLDAPAIAFGADFKHGTTSTELLDFVVDVDGTTHTIAGNNSDGFFGFVWDDVNSFQSVKLQSRGAFADNSIGGRFGFDNVVLASELAPPAAVPELSSLLLFGIGLSAAAIRRKRLRLAGV